MPESAYHIHIHDNKGRQTAELTSDGVVIRSERDFLDIVADAGAQGLDEFIFHEVNLAPEFFKLATGLAGAILQKCSTYMIRVALVGDFGRYQSEPLQAFIRESNRGRQVFFVGTVEEGLRLLATRRRPGGKG